MVKIVNSISLCLLLFLMGNVSGQTLTPLSATVTPGDCRDLIIEGTIAYVADGEMGLSLYDIANPEQPSYIGTLGHQNDDIAKSVWKRPEDDIAFIADMDGKILCLDVSLPLNPNSYRNVSLGFDQNVEDVYGITYQDTLYLFSVNSLFTHRIVSFFQIVYRTGIPGFGDYYIVYPIEVPADAFAVVADSMYVYVAEGVAGLYIFDISDIRQPTLLSTLDLIGRSSGIFVKDNYAYITAETAGLIIVDITDREMPFEVSQIGTGGMATDVHVVGNYALVTDSNAGLLAFDVTDPYDPILVSTYNTPGQALGVYADSDLICVADYDSLFIFAYGSLTGIADDSVKPRDHEISANYPNPFNANTSIEFSLARQTHVNLTVYDIQGRAVETLLDQELPAGTHRHTWNASAYPSGIYLYKLSTGSYQETKKMILLK